MEISNFVKTITYFTLFYPIVMSVLWIVGALLYEVLTKKIKEEDLEGVKEQPFTIIVPIYNEQDEIYENLEKNLKLDYANYEVWAIDDGSTDNSFEQLSKLNDKRLKVFKNDQNLGKAATINKYLNDIKTDYFLIIDSDTTLNSDSLKYFNYSINKDVQEAIDNNKENKYVGYTGNITVKSKDKDKNKIFIVQKIEYRSFIDMIKRSQFIITKSIMTLSGACSCYKTSAAIEIGGFNETNATEDINISWRFNNNGLRLKYLSQAKASVSTPLYVYDVIKQRQRWTVGLFQTIKQNFKGLFSLKNNFLKIYILEIFTSSVWAFTLFFSSIYYILNILMQLSEDIYLFRFIYGILLVLIFSVSLSLISYKISENNNEKLRVFFKNYFWFPFAYYLIQPIGFTLGLKDFIFNKQKGKWRQKTKESSRYIFSTITDLLITFIIFRIILEILEDSYSVLNNVPIKTLIYIYFVVAALFSLLYFTKLRVGNKFVNRKYPLKYSTSIYMTIMSFVFNLRQFYLFSIGEISINNFYRYHYQIMIGYVLIATLLTFIFVKIIKKNENHMF